MKLKKTLFRVVLTLTVLCTGSVMTNTAQSFACTQFCQNSYNACMVECNGDAPCQAACYRDWECCMYMCTGSGSCW